MYDGLSHSLFQAFPEGTGVRLSAILGSGAGPSLGAPAHAVPPAPIASATGSTNDEDDVLRGMMDNDWAGAVQQIFPSQRTAAVPQTAGAKVCAKAKAPGGVKRASSVASPGQGGAGKRGRPATRLMDQAMKLLDDYRQSASDEKYFGQHNCFRRQLERCSKDFSNAILEVGSSLPTGHIASQHFRITVLHMITYKVFCAHMLIYIV